MYIYIYLTNQVSVSDYVVLPDVPLFMYAQRSSLLRFVVRMFKAYFRRAIKT